MYNIKLLYLLTQIVDILLCFNKLIFRYDPYEKKFTQELYDHERMKSNRESAVRNAGREGRFGLILGTLGRQGSTKVLSNLKVGVCVTSYN